MPNVIAICKPADMCSIMATLVEWEEVFDVTVLSAVTAEEGLKTGQQMM